MIHYVLSPPATESNKAMHTSGIPASAHHPLIDPEPLLLIEIRAKHDQPIELVGPTEPPV